MLSVEGLKLSLGGKVLFDGIDFRLQEGQKVALAGRNGQGKSSLMKAIMGLVPCEAGSIGLPRGRTVGYLPQDIKPPGTDRTVLEEVLAGLADFAALEAELERLAARMAETPDDHDLLETYGRVHARYEAANPYDAEARGSAILAGLGFSQERIGGPLNRLSGGWLMRAHLARLLLEQPDVLLLDEPTNHLDIEAREWLLEFLQRFPGALLLTSHDRYFLDHLVDRVFELEGGKLEVYTGNLTAYEVEKVARLDRLKAAHARQQRELERQMRFIESNRARAATASNVQSRIKQIEKIERIELPPDPPDIRLRFPDPPRSGAVAFRATGLGKRYGDLQVFAGLDLELPAGEKLAVVGVNGAGKTTFLKLLAGRETPSDGSLALGHNVELQYFSQYEDDIADTSRSLLQVMDDAAPPNCPIPRRTVLGCFLFSGDDVHKPVGVLSGGERARLKLARILLRPCNLLVLDEPTNHLDLFSKDLLLRAVQDFPGTVVFVSHDRQFMAELATQVLELRDGKPTLYPCGYEQYRWRLAQDARAAAAAREAQASSNGGQAKAAAAPLRPAQVARADARELKKLQRQADSLVEEIAAHEARLVDLEAQMGEPGFFEQPERSTPVVQQHRQLQELIASSYQALEQAMERLESARAG